MNKDIWTDKLRKKLADSQSSVPEDLWKDIEQKLDALPVEKRKPHVLPLYRWVAAAACLLLLVGVGVSLLHDTTTLPAEIRVPSEGGRRMAEGGPTEPSAQKAPLPTASSALLAKVEPKTILRGKPCEATRQTSVEGSVEEAQPAPVALSSQDEAPVEKAQTENAQPRVPKSKMQAKSSSRDYARTASGFKTSSASRHARFAGWSAGLYASNVMLGNVSNGINSAPVLAVMSSSFSADVATDNKLMAASQPRYVEDAKEKADHKMPVSFGLSVKYRLSDRWALATGVVYTRLRSDFTHQASTGSIVDEQVLHYIGVPLKVEYRVWSLGGFSSYLTAGGELDKNFKAKVSTDGAEQNIKKDRLQWSADAAVGAQYNIIPQLGVYVEPGVKYYFNNHSPVENTFKDKPWNFNLQIGLRWNLDNNKK